MAEENINNTFLLKAHSIYCRLVHSQILWISLYGNSATTTTKKKMKTFCVQICANILLALLLPFRYIYYSGIHPSSTLYDCYHETLCIYYSSSERRVGHLMDSLTAFRCFDTGVTLLAEHVFSVRCEYLAHLHFSVTSPEKKTLVSSETLIF